MYSTAIIKTEKISDDLYVMTETDSVHCYLILGAARALLFDVGYGYESLMPIIRSITPLPLTVVLSHGDPDHALGSFNYETVYIHPLDYGKLKMNDSREMKEKAIAHRVSKMPNFKSLISAPAYYEKTLSGVHVEFIKDGDCFDLGGKHISVVHIPGHSYGSIALLDRESRRLFTGDMVVDYNIYYFFSQDQQASFQTALQSWKKLKTLSSAYDAIYAAHGTLPITVEWVEDLIECMEADILENSADDEVIDTFMGPAYRHLYKTVNLLYSKTRLDMFRASQRCV